MRQMRVYEIARAAGVDSKTVMAFVDGLGGRPTRSPSSPVPPIMGQTVVAALVRQREAAETARFLRTIFDAPECG